MNTKLMWSWSKTETTIEEICGCVGPGWKNIVTDLTNDLLALGWEGKIAQVKEKMGSLRYYLDGVPDDNYDAIYDRIEAAEEQSAETCETCGASGKIHSFNGWLRTVCDIHKPSI